MPNAHHKPDKTLLTKLGENVRRERKRKGYTQEHLAELVDVHPRMIQEVEYGDTNLLVTTAMRLVAALECKWEDLMPQVPLPRSMRQSRRVKATK